MQKVRVLLTLLYLANTQLGLIDIQSIFNFNLITLISFLIQTCYFLISILFLIASDYNLLAKTFSLFITFCPVLFFIFIEDSIPNLVLSILSDFTTIQKIAVAIQGGIDS